MFAVLKPHHRSANKVRVSMCMWALGTRPHLQNSVHDCVHVYVSFQCFPKAKKKKKKNLRRGAGVDCVWRGDKYCSWVKAFSPRPPFFSSVFFSFWLSFSSFYLVIFCLLSIKTWPWKPKIISLCQQFLQLCYSFSTFDTLEAHVSSRVNWSS